MKKLKNFKKALSICLTICMLVTMAAPLGASAAADSSQDYGLLKITKKRVKNGNFTLKNGTYNKVVVKKGAAGSFVKLKNVKTVKFKANGSDDAAQTTVKLVGSTKVKKLIAKAHMKVISKSGKSKVKKVSVRANRTVRINVPTKKMNIRRATRRATVIVNAKADAINVRGNKNTVSVNADTDLLNVPGNKNIIFLKKNAEEIKVPGNKNIIVVFGEAGTIRVSGKDNIIIIRKKGHIKHLIITGDGTVVKGNGTVDKVDVDANNTTINVNAGTVVTSGDSDGTTVHGIDVPADSTAKVTSTQNGNETVIHYIITNNGTGEQTEGTKTITVDEDGNQTITTVDGDGNVSTTVIDKNQSENDNPGEDDPNFVPLDPGSSDTSGNGSGSAEEPSAKDEVRYENASGIAYTDFKTAVATANSESVPVTITLLKDIKLSETIVFAGNPKQITLDLNAHTITGIGLGDENADNNEIFEVGNATLQSSNDSTTVNSKEAANLLITGDGRIQKATAAGNVISLYYGSNLVLDGNFTISDSYAAENDGYQSAVVVYGDIRDLGTDSRGKKTATSANTTLNVENVHITDTTYGISAYGGCIVNIHGGTIESTAKDLYSPAAAVSGNGFVGTKDGNAIAYDGTRITVTGGTITGGAYNAGIYQPQDGYLNISGGTVEGCSGIDVKAGEVTVSDGYVREIADVYGRETNILGSDVDKRGDGVIAVKGAVVLVERAGYSTNNTDIDVYLNGGVFDGNVYYIQSSQNSGHRYEYHINPGANISVHYGSL